jgi:homoserine trans-succinylase
VELVTDQVILAKIAVEAWDWDVGIIAVKKLTDQVLLAKVGNEAHAVVRESAINKLTDLKLLANLVAKGDFFVASYATARRLYLIRNLTDQSILARENKRDRSNYSKPGC